MAYFAAGNYTFHVIASNQINSVSWQGSLMVVNNIVGLSFKKDPKDIPGEAGVPYTVEFQLDGGDGVVFMIDSGMNLSQFLTCANLTNERLLANFT